MKKKSSYVKKRIAQIKAEQRKSKPRRVRRKKVKVIPIQISTNGFFLKMDYSPQDKDDVNILIEANNLINRRANN